MLLPRKLGPQCIEAKNHLFFFTQTGKHLILRLKHNLAGQFVTPLPADHITLSHYRITHIDGELTLPARSPCKTTTKSQIQIWACDTSCSNKPSGKTACGRSNGFSFTGHHSRQILPAPNALLLTPTFQELHVSNTVPGCRPHFPTVHKMQPVGSFSELLTAIAEQEGRQSLCCKSRDVFHTLPSHSFALQLLSGHWMRSSSPSEKRQCWDLPQSLDILKMLGLG